MTIIDRSGGIASAGNPTMTDRRTGIMAGIAIKAPCKAASTAALTLSGEQTVDGVSCVAGDRVLVKDQVATATNGVYVVSAGLWTRATDFDSVDEIAKGTMVYVATGGTTNGAILFSVTSADPTTIDSSSIAFTTVLGYGPGVVAWLANPTSANLLAAVTDETGTGALVFGTSPTFTTKITVPLIVGATTAAGQLILQSTSNGSPASDFIIFKTGGANRLFITTGGSVLSMNNSANTFGGKSNYQAYNDKSYQNFIGYTRTSDDPTSDGCQSGYFLAENDAVAATHTAWPVYAEGRAGNNGFTVGAEIDTQNTSGVTPRTVDPNNIFGPAIAAPVNYAIWSQPDGTKVVATPKDSSAWMGVTDNVTSGNKFLKGIVFKAIAIRSVGGHMEAINFGADQEIVWYSGGGATGRLSSNGSLLTSTTQIEAPLVTVSGGAPSFLTYKATGINFNSANTDTAVAISLPTGYTRFAVLRVTICHASGTLTTSTFGVFTAAAGAGTAIVAGGTANTISTASEGTNNNTMLNSASNTTSYLLASVPNIYFRVQTAQGTAATADIIVVINPLP